LTGFRKTLKFEENMYSFSCKVPVILVKFQ